MGTRQLFVCSLNFRWTEGNIASFNGHTDAVRKRYRTPERGEAMQSQNLFRVDVYNSFKHDFLLNAARSQTFADVMLLKFDSLSRVTCLVWR